ncbi:hypothetical protein B0H13DRAFT_2306570 [Mycena leptocephala]|nr:hypothetical protein B0H13DRAFT_2306570 [Mycena leptocephala]
MPSHPVPRIPFVLTQLVAEIRTHPFPPSPVVGTSCPVSYYTPPPLKCYNCQEFGHMAKACSRKDSAVSSALDAQARTLHATANVRIPRAVPMPERACTSKCNALIAVVPTNLPISGPDLRLSRRVRRASVNPEVLMSLLNDTSPSKFNILTVQELPYFIATQASFQHKDWH